MEDSKKTDIVTVLLSVIGFASILINLSLKGVDYVNILDAVKDSVGLLITLIVFVIAMRIKQGSETPLLIAERALKKIQGKYSELLMGPSYNKEDQEDQEDNTPEDNKSTRTKYLFMKPLNYHTKTTLIDLGRLEQGILDIRLSKSTLKNVNYQDNQLTVEKINELQDRLKNKILGVLEKKYAEAYTAKTGKRSKGQSAVIIDFDESQMGLKKFGKAIYEVAEIIVEFLKEEINRNSKKV